MGLNAQPSGERVHIGFFGLRNAGKSSVVNRVTGQTLSIVSDVKGTTTDPVQKAMELLPIGPVVIIDTPGIDDEGTLGAERVRRRSACWKRRILRFSSRTARAVCSLPSRNCLSCFASGNFRLLSPITKQI